MSGAIPPLSQYAFMAWCSVKAQGQLYLTTILDFRIRILSGASVAIIHKVVLLPSCNC
jgi:hypothetical protein